MIEANWVENSWVEEIFSLKCKITSTQMYKDEFLLNQGLGESVKLVWKDKERAEDKVFTQLEEVLIG